MGSTPSRPDVADRPAVRVDLIDRLLVRGPGDPVGEAELGGRRGAVLLARLLLDAGRVVRREALAAALWDGEPPPTWQPALRNVVAGVRAALAAAGVQDRLALRTVGDGYALHLDDVDVDVLALEAGAAAAQAALDDHDHRRALQLAGQLVSPLGATLLAGTAGEWVEQARTHVEDLVRRLTRAGAEAALELGEHREAERLARRLVAANPLREDGHRLLMRALHAAGDSGEALRAYDACRRILRDELGSVPSAATEAVYLAILRGRAPLPGEASGGGSPSSRLLLIARNAPMVGRDAALAQLVDRMAAADADGPQLVLVRGEAGIGKTRLAAALVAHAAAEGRATTYGRADDRLTTPYAAVLEAVDGHLAGLPATVRADVLGPHAAVLSRMVPAVAQIVSPSAPTGVPDVDRRAVVRALAHALRVTAAASGERAGVGAVVVLDDLQWARRPTWTVIGELLADPTPTPVLLVGLHRADTEPRLDDDVARGPRVHRLDLEPLTAADVAVLAGVAPADEGDAAAPATRLWQDSGGNPLLLGELLRGRGGERGDAHARLGPLVRARLAALPAAAGPVLEVAAVAGLEFDPQVVEGIASASPGLVADVLAAAQRIGLLAPAIGRPGWLAFRHAMVHQAVLDGVDARRRTDVHLHLGRLLEAQPAFDGSTAALAHHFGHAGPQGDWRRAVRYGLSVARAALEAGVPEDAATVAARTIALLEDAGAPDPLAALDCEVVLGAALREAGDPRSHDTLRAAFQTAVALGDAERMADAALAFTQGGAAADEAYLDGLLRPLYERALEEPLDPGRRARLLGNLATGTAWGLGLAAATPIVAEALDVASRHVDRHVDRATAASVLTSVRRSLTGSLRRDLQTRVEDELLALAEDVDDDGCRARAWLWRYETALEHGDGEALGGAIAAAAHHVGRLRMGSYHHTVAYTRAALALLRGDLDEAEDRIGHAARVGAEHHLAMPIVEAIRLLQLHALRTEQGRAGEVRDAVVAFFGGAQLPEWQGMVALAEVAVGDEAAARAAIRTYAAAIRAKGPSMINPPGLIAHTAPAAVALGDQDLLAEWYDQLLPHAGRGAYFALFAGPFDHTLGLLARALGREDAARAHLQAGAAFADRLGAPGWAARCRHLATIPPAGPPDPTRADEIPPEQVPT